MRVTNLNMPPRRRFDKKNATTFAVVHRGHDDEKYFDNDASRHVLVPITQKQSQKKKVQTKDELEDELKEDIKTIRDNEGLAAQYGIYYDDTKYDYMQHLKPIGEAEDAVFIAKKEEKPKGKKQDIMEILKEQLPSETKKNITQADLENIPRELQGFNPNLDPRLRETLEALEDEAYIGEDENANIDDFFKDILQSGEADDEEFYEEFEDGEYDEWDMDNYDDEYAQYDDEGYDTDKLEQIELPYNEGEAPEDMNNIVVDNSWEKDFRKFKKESKFLDDSDDDFDDEDEEQEHLEKDDLPGLPDIPGSKKFSKTKLRKKKGAMTDVTSFSMTSSAVYRTEGLTLLDDRYEKLANDFGKIDEEEEYKEFKMEDERQDFEDMLDDFLDNYELDRGGRKLMKKNEELENIQKAADKASNSKLAKRRQKEKQSLTSGFGNLKI